MLLVVTNQDDATSDYLCGRLAMAGLSFVRFDSEAVPERAEVSYVGSRATLRLGERWWAPEDFTNVWYRRPKPLAFDIGVDRAERAHSLAEWAEALEGFFAHIPYRAWMNHPSANACSSHKIEQLSRATRFGLDVPPSVVTQDAAVARGLWADSGGRLVVKPLASGHLEREDPAQDTLIYTNRVAEEDLADVGLVVHCPTLFQMEVSKQIDVRVCVIDDEVTATGITAASRLGGQRIDIRRNNMTDVEYVSLTVPADVSDKLLELVRSYSLRFSAIDMGVDSDGRWWFFEVNPNGQWAWLDIAGGCDIAASFIRSFSR
jgi:hypothetical protein